MCSSKVLGQQPTPNPPSAPCQNAIKMTPEWEHLSLTDAERTYWAPLICLKQELHESQLHALPAPQPFPQQVSHQGSDLLQALGHSKRKKNHLNKPHQNLYPWKT